MKRKSSAKKSSSKVDSTQSEQKIPQNDKPFLDLSTSEGAVETAKTQPLPNPLGIDKPLNNETTNKIPSEDDLPDKIDLPMDASDETPQDKRNKTFFITGISVSIFIFITVFITFLIALTRPVEKPVNLSEIKTTSVTKAVISEEMLSPTFAQSKWTIEVLNGSGISGMAKKTADKLAARGYVITKTGNAPGKISKDSQVYINSSVSNDVDIFISDVQNVLTVTKAGSFSDSTASARIIVGSQ